MKDPYEVLGVPKTASEADIKKAFRSLAKKHHPDKHAGDAAAQKRFQEISGAYDILGDTEKRAQYDAGAIGADGNPKYGASGAGGASIHAKAVSAREILLAQDLVEARGSFISILTKPPVARRVLRIFSPT